MQGFKVSVAEILGQPGCYRDIRLEQPVPGVESALAVLTDDPVEAALRAEAVVEGVLVTGGLTGSMQARCARCLKDIPADVSVDVCELYVTPGHEVPQDEDSYEVNGLEIDLEPLMRDALALALPLNPLCAPDCKGLCATCGQDLNEGPCSCTEEEIDPRWAALSDLRERLTDPRGESEPGLRDRLA